MVRNLLVGAIVAVFLLAVVPAQATLISGDGVQVVRIWASNGQESGSAVFVVPAGGDGDTDLPAEAGTIRGSSGEVIGQISGLELSNGSDPDVLLGFHVVAGPTDTDFMIQTELLAFSAIVNPVAFATAGVSLTDNDGDGASLTGLYTGSQAYQARYNNPAVEFTTLLDPLTAAPDDTSVLADREPDTGTTMILATVDSIQASFNFTLSANDQAAATSRFSVVPEPATLIVMALGCIPLMRRRR